jgi:G3E family GTPase
VTSAQIPPLQVSIMTASKVPVTVLTGFLGAGKTTLLNRILSEEHGMRIAVVENELGALGIDDQLIARRDELFIELSNGCVCCTSLGDLVPILERLVDQPNDFDRVLIETTGIADPGPVARAFVVEPLLREHYELDGIVTVVDARHLSQHLDDDEWSCSRQMALADRIVLNKLDLVNAEGLKDTRALVRQYNPTAPCRETSFAEVPLEHVLVVGGWNSQDGYDLSAESADGRHGDIVALSFEVTGRLHPARLESFLSLLLREYGADLVRMKGLFCMLGEERYRLIQGVHAALDTREGGAVKSSLERSQCVFIGKDLDREFIASGLEACQSY